MSVEVDVEVKDVPERDRYEASVDGEVVGLLEYRRDPRGVVLLTHAEVASDIENRGIGTELVREALDDLALKGERIMPLCSFVRAFVRENPDYHHLVA